MILASLVNSSMDYLFNKSIDFYLNVSLYVSVCVDQKQIIKYFIIKCLLTMLMLVWLGSLIRIKGEQVVCGWWHDCWHVQIIVNDNRTLTLLQRVR